MYQFELAQATFEKGMERNNSAQAVKLVDEHVVTHLVMSRALQ